MAALFSFAIVGAGAMGAKHARLLARLPGVKITRVVDRDLARARALAAEVKGEASASCDDLAGTVSAAVVAVPASEHHLVASGLLRAGIHLLVEKPLTPDPDSAAELCSLARQHGCLLQVGHIERFNPAFGVLRKDIPHPRFLRFERRSMYTGRGTDVDVLLDLMIHDLDMALLFANGSASEIKVQAWPPPPALADAASARIIFENGLVAEFFATRLAAAPARTILAFADEVLGEADLLSRSVRFVHRETDGSVPFSAAPGEDALLAQDRAFLEALAGRGTVPADGEVGLRAVRLADQVRRAARRSR